MRRALLVAALIAAPIVAFSGLGAQSSGDALVTVETGALRGVVRDGVVAYLGVPYAAPPVGTLRWREPQPASKWQGVRAADKFGNDCVQHRQYDQTQSEDCLFPNVWTPADATGRRLPVMFWIYGGGLS